VTRLLRFNLCKINVAGKQRRWDMISSHSSVGVIIYHTELDALVVVRQFRPPVSFLLLLFMLDVKLPFAALCYSLKRVSGLPVFFYALASLSLALYNPCPPPPGLRTWGQHKSYVVPTYSLVQGFFNSIRLHLSKVMLLLDAL